MSELTPLQYRVFVRLNENFGQDVYIAALYVAAYPDRPQDVATLTPRQMQQRLGAVIAKLNRRIQPSARVVPGNLKRTYRIERSA